MQPSSTNGLFDFPRQLLALTLRLPPPRAAVRVQRGIPVPMPDGTRLYADHYAPLMRGPNPAILIRTPYGRGGEIRLGPGFTLAEWPAQQLAERGFHVLVQGVRGRFASEGSFTPHLQEADDGAATLAWIARQPWFSGRLGTWGPSYLGYAQWAAAARAPEAIHAMLPLVCGSNPFAVAYPDGAFALETRLRWAQSTAMLEKLYRGDVRGLFGAEARLRRAFRRLPLAEADVTAVGAPLPHYRAALLHERVDDPFWRERDHSSAIGAITAPAHLIGGWYDYFLRPLLHDYQTLAAAGRAPRLTIGPWSHSSPGMLFAGLREGLRWFDLHLRGEGTPRRHPVWLFLTGAGAWRGFAAFPPPATERRLFLHAGRRLAAEAPASHAEADSFVYDPADPTPVAGGALLGGDSGPREQRAVEARGDLLCYSTAPLPEPLDVIGVVRLELYVRSSAAHTDFVGRLCDVAPDGRSLHCCDGLVRVSPGATLPRSGDCLRLVVELGPIAHRFARGHRLRLHVASAAHPRWARNLGTGEPAATGSRTSVAHQTIYRDAARPSALVLPVAPGAGEPAA